MLGNGMSVGHVFMEGLTRYIKDDSNPTQIVFNICKSAVTHLIKTLLHLKDEEEKMSLSLIKLSFSVNTLVLRVIHEY